jgi:hypothetical protein
MNPAIYIGISDTAARELRSTITAILHSPGGYFTKRAALKLVQSATHISECSISNCNFLTFDPNGEAKEDEPGEPDKSNKETTNAD